MFTCAVASAGISLGRGIYKMKHGHKMDGLLDIAGAGTFSAAKGLKYANETRRSIKIGGTAAGKAGKKARSRIVKEYKHFDRKVVRTADRVDKAYGAFGLGMSAWGFGGWLKRNW